jgi:PAS domain S-box-containing protein
VFLLAPHVVILFFVAAFTSVVTVWVWRCRRQSSNILILLLLAAIIWTLGEGLDTGSSDVVAKFFFEKVKYFGIVVIPGGWTIYALQQTGREKWVSRRNVALMSIVPLFSLALVLTNEAHGLFFSQVTLNPSNPFLPLNETWAPGFILFVGYAYALLTATSLLATQMLVRSSHLYSRHAIALLVTTLSPWIFCLLFQFTPQNFVFDPTPLAMCVAGSAMALINPVRLHVEDIVSVAHGSVVESMIDPVIVLDESDRIVDLNPAAQDLTDLPRSQVIGSRLEQMLSRSNQTGGQFNTTDAGGEFVLVKAGEPRTFDVRTSPVVDWRGRLSCRVVALRDVTERKKAEEELQKRTNQQTSLMRTSAEMIRSSNMRERLQIIAGAIRDQGWRRVVISVRDEKMEMTSPDDLVTVGLTNEERESLWNKRPPGQVVRKRFGPEYERFKIGEFYYLPWSDPWVRETYSKTFVVLSHLGPEEMIDWDPDDLLYAPLRLAEGRIVGRLSMDDPADGKRPTKESLAPLELFLYQAAVAIENAQLIQQLDNARVQLQEYANKLEVKVADRTRELTEAQDKLLRSERLAAIGELAGMVGHDLRNPLTGIAGATYYLKMKTALKSSEKEKGMFVTIEHAIDYSNKIINDLLEYSGEIKLDRTETDPKSLLVEALSRIGVPAGTRIVNQTKSQPRLEVDKEKMQRVFINMIKNAFDAMPNGGVLKIRSEKTENHVSFIFVDTGTGMSKETLKKLWTPLFTTKAKGMGFGLPICKRIVEAHGGKISVESNVGRGTTMAVTIPTNCVAEDKGEVWANLPESLLSAVASAHAPSQKC